MEQYAALKRKILHTSLKECFTALVMTVLFGGLAIFAVFNLFTDTIDMGNGTVGGILICLVMLGLTALALSSLIPSIKDVSGAQRQKVFARLKEILGRPEMTDEEAMTSCRVDGNFYFFDEALLWLVKGHLDIASAPELVWTYMGETTHRVYFVKTGKTYAVHVGTLYKKEVAVPVGTAAEAQAVCRVIAKQYQALAGFSTEISQLFFKDPGALIALQQQQVAAQEAETAQPETVNP